MSKDKMRDLFKTPEELEKYSEAQYQTILAQSKKISELEKLKEKLEARNQELETQATVSSALNVGPKDMSDEETICVVQLALLRGKSMQGELTAEECKKTETYVKTLSVIRGKNVDQAKKTVEKMDTAALMAEVDEALEQ